MTARKKFADIIFTASEKAAINEGFTALENVADRLGSTAAAYLAKALKLETTGPDGVTMIFAKGLLCEWFRNARASDGRVADLYGRREASILISIIAAQTVHLHRDEIEAMRFAAGCKDAGFSRRPNA